MHGLFTDVCLEEIHDWDVDLEVLKQALPLYVDFLVEVEREELTIINLDLLLVLQLILWLFVSGLVLHLLRDAEVSQVVELLYEFNAEFVLHLEVTGVPVAVGICSTSNALFDSANFLKSLDRLGVFKKLDLEQEVNKSLLGLEEARE